LILLRVIDKTDGLHFYARRRWEKAVQKYYAGNWKNSRNRNRIEKNIEKNIII